MARLLCKTRGNTTSQGKPRVYFSCHGLDWELYFETVTEEILKYSDCAVFYYDPALEPDAFDLEDLRQMQLFVIPITTQLLFTKNRVVESELPLARIERIPILPLLQEPDLEEEYARVFGNTQYLSKIDEDPTAIPYEEKLRKYLQSVLIEEKLAQKIRAAFDAYVFLSYRKKDRKFAQELMRLIHKIPYCRDLAIWYDEFLNPGEDFNDAIAAALKKSDLFVLTVTPNLVNEQNYIQTTEYPMAVAADKTILPVQMDPTDGNALRAAYQNIPGQVNPWEEERFAETLRTALCSVALRENDSPEHNFFIGLAYFSGMDVEVDRDRAVKLITGAAEAGLPAAIEKIAQMYATGDGVAQDEGRAIQWREKLLEQAKRRYESTGEIPVGHDYMGALYELAQAWWQFGELEKSRALYHQLMHCALELSKITDDGQCKWFLAVAYRHTGISFRINQEYKQAESYLLKSKDIWEQLVEKGERHYQHNLAIAYKELGDISDSLYGYTNKERLAAHIAASGWFQKALTIYEEIAQSGRSEHLHALADFYELLGSYRRSFKLDRVQHKSEWLQMALKIRQELVKSGTTYDLRRLAATYTAIARYSARENEQKWYMRAAEIWEKIANGNDHAAQWNLARVYWSSGQEEKAIVLAQELSVTGVTRYMRMLAEWYCELADREWDAYFQACNKEHLAKNCGELPSCEVSPNLYWEEKFQELLDRMIEKGLYESEENLIRRFVRIGIKYSEHRMYKEAIAYKMRALDLREKMARRDSSVCWKLFRECEDFRLTCSAAKEMGLEEELLRRSFALLEALGEPPDEELAFSACLVYDAVGLKTGNSAITQKANQLRAKWGDPFADIFG